jgi:hypothetical protein
MRSGFQKTLTRRLKQAGAICQWAAVFTDYRLTAG